MAASIFHGAPGSFKSASAVWFEVLPALRQGRLVVTNIEGILPIEDIENVLNETFPESAKLWRMSSQNDTGQKLWRNWFHWMPCGALIVMDEVQDIYPTETTQFKPESCDYQHISKYQDLLPSEWYEYHLSTLETYKPENLTSGDVDDLGIELFNEHGHIIYPSTLKEAYMRHRKYNWDIICCTPDITSVHKYIRNVSQYAYAHKYFDGLSKIPYYFRRPRIHEHNPKLDGKTPNKDDPKSWRKIPLDVHKCYKSTATKSITASTGHNFLLSPVFAFPVFIVGCCLIYIVLFFAGAFDVDKDGSASTVRVEAGRESAAITAPNDTVQIVNGVDISLDVPDTLPYNSHQMFISGVITAKIETTYQYDVVFEVKTEDGIAYIDSNDLEQMGYNVNYFSQCKAVITLRNTEYVSYCKPRQPPKVEQEPPNMQFNPTFTPQFEGDAPSEA